MSVAKIYSGPAKVILCSSGDTPIKVLQAEGEAGVVNLSLNTERVKRYSAFGGYEGTNPMDQTAKISLTPFDDWSALPCLFPFAVVGCTGATPSKGLLLPGMRAHDKQAGGLNAAPTLDGCGSTQLWTPSGTLWRIVRTAITKHPSLKLGPGMPFFGGIEITGLVDPAMVLGAAGALIDTTLHVAGTGTATGVGGDSSPVADPATDAFKGGFINGLWTGLWGSTGAFGTAPTGMVGLESDGGWELSCDAKYGVSKGAGRTYHMSFEGVEFAIKGKLIGPTASAMQAIALAYSLGQDVSAATPGTSLVLAGPGTKTITLNNCIPMMESSGYQFGGSALTVGEIAFVTSVTYDASAVPDVVLQFSAA
jgi:hypothetical protein